MFSLEIILQIVILLWLFIATKEKLEYEDFVELTDWEKGSTCGKSIWSV